MQLPFCAADPIRGAQVNVGGTVTIFELAKRLGVERVVYASSAAVYGPRTHYQEATLGPGAAFFPTSHYGVYKVARRPVALKAHAARKAPRRLSEQFVGKTR